MIALSKISETSSTITLGWTPPAGVEWYIFYAAGVRVSNAAPVDKSGLPKATIKFSKGHEPYQIVALLRQAGVFTVDGGSYPSSPSDLAIYPSTSRYPSETP